MHTPAHDPIPTATPGRTGAGHTGPGPARTEPARTGHNLRLGATGENIAAEYLVARGFVPVAHNWRCRYGELDLVMRDGGAYVAVEVKTRSGTCYGSPLEAITARKAARLRRLLLEWSAQTGNRGGELRVDAVGITLRPGAESPSITYLRAIA